jgi:hypothetical protein
MLDVTVTAQVPRGPEDAFEFVAEGFFENHHRWDPAVEMVKDGAGPVAVGTRGRETRRFLGRQVVQVEITELARPGRFALRNVDGPFELDRGYTFEPVPGGTLIRFTFRMRPRPLPLRLLFPLLAPTIARQVRTNIGRLSDLLSTAPNPAHD